MEDNRSSVPAPANVDRDAACPRCGYNVRGLRANGRCPECSAPVSVALHEGDPAYFDPEWLAKVRGAAKRAWLGFVAGMAGFALLGWLSDYGIDLPSLASGVIVILVSLLAAGGLWQIATPNPILVTGEPPWSARRLVRSMTVVTMGTLGASVRFVDLAGWRSVIGVNAVTGPLGLAGAIGALGLSEYSKTLATLFADDFTTQRSGVYRNSYLTVWPVVLFGALGLSFGGNAAFACVLVPGVGGLLAFGILVLALPMYLVPHLERSLEAAEKNWTDAIARSVA